MKKVSTGFSKDTHKKRNEAIDLGRVFGSMAVIAAHIAPGDIWTERVAAITISCHVPFFFLVAMIYFFPAIWRMEEPVDLVKKQSLRILLPLLAWTAVYAATMWLKDLVTGQERVWDWIGVLFYGQGAVHLYFLPVLFWLQMVSLSISRIIRKSHTGLWMTVLVFCSIFAWWGYSRDYLGWGGIVTSAPFFILVGWCFALRNRYAQRHSPAVSGVSKKLKIGAGLLLFIAAATLNLTDNKTGFASTSFTPLIGAAGFYMILANFNFCFTSPAVKIILSMSYGVYLCHFLFIEGIEFILKRIGHLPPVYSWKQEAVLTLAVFLVAVFTVAVIRKSGVMRRILLGES